MAKKYFSGPKISDFPSVSFISKSVIRRYHTRNISSDFINNEQLKFKEFQDEFVKGQSFCTLPCIKMYKKNTQNKKSVRVEFIDKAVGPSSSTDDFIQLYKKPTRVILATPATHQPIKLKVHGTRTKIPSENKALKFISQHLKTLIIPRDKFQGLLNGSKIILN
jgi:hypothetical protein